jgi:hypothetical protein
MKKNHEMNVKDMKGKKKMLCLGLVAYLPFDEDYITQHKWHANWNDKKLLTIKNLAVFLTN